MDSFVGASLGNEAGTPILDFLFFLRGHFVWLFGVLHLADVDNIVIAIDKQIYLRTFSFRGAWPIPRAHTADGTENTESFLNLSDMQKTNTLKSESAPVVIGWRTRLT